MNSRWLAPFLAVGLMVALPGSATGGWEAARGALPPDDRATSVPVQMDAKRSCQREPSSLSQGSPHRGGDLAIEEDLQIRRSEPRDAAEGVINGGFEGGELGWEFGSDTSNAIRPAPRPAVVTSRVRSGSRTVVLGEENAPCEQELGVDGFRLSSWIYQDIEVPSSGPAELSLYYRIFTYDKWSGDKFDRFEVYLDGTRVANLGNTSSNYGCSDPINDLGWREFAYDMSAYSGQTVRLKLANVTNPEKTYATWTYVDDVSVSWGDGPSIYAVYLPTGLRRWPGILLWEIEPNGNGTDVKGANGPLVSRKTYRGYPNDQDDYFYFELSASATVNVLVEDFAPTSSYGDLLLYGPAPDDQRGPFIAHFGEREEPSMSLGPHTLGPGKYYVRVYTAGDRSTTQAYRLTVTY